MLYAELISFFEEIGKSDPFIEQTYIGDYRQITEAQLSDLTFPLLWIETPEVNFTGDEDSNEIQYFGALVILDLADQNDITISNSVLNKTQQIGFAILLQMSKSDLARSYISKKSMTPIEGMTIEGAIGWRIDYTLNAKPDLSIYCENPYPIIIPATVVESFTANPFGSGNQGYRISVSLVNNPRPDRTYTGEVDFEADDYFGSSFIARVEITGNPAIDVNIEAQTPGDYRFDIKIYEDGRFLGVAELNGTIT